MLQVSDSKLYRIRQQVTRQVQLPEEMTVSLDADRLQSLLSEIESATSNDDFQILVARLPRRQLNDLFGLLLVVESDQQQIIERIQTILERRATRSLAQIGWAFFQQHFFLAELATAMNRMTKALIEKGEKDLFLTRSQVLTCDAQYAIKLASAWLDEQAQARQQKTSWNLPTQLLEHNILADSPFFVALLRSFFTRCPVGIIATDAELFARCLDQSTDPEKADLLTALYADYRLEPAFDTVNRAVMKRFGMPQPTFEHPIWSVVASSVRQHFRQWALIDLVQKHIQDHKRKLLFYKPLLMQIENFELLDAQTLAVEFKQFYIVDHQDFSHRVIYYDRNKYLDARQKQTPVDELSMPWNGVFTAREAILKQQRVNQAVLMLDEINLLYARDFIQEQAGPVRKNSII